MAGFANLGLGQLGNESQYYQNSGGKGIDPLSYAIGYGLDQLTGGSPLGKKMMGQPAGAAVPDVPTVAQVPPITTNDNQTPVIPATNNIPAIANSTQTNNPVQILLGKWSSYMGLTNGQ